MEYFQAEICAGLAALEVKGLEDKEDNEFLQCEGALIFSKEPATKKFKRFQEVGTSEHMQPLDMQSFSQRKNQVHLDHMNPVTAANFIVFKCFVNIKNY